MPLLDRQKTDPNKILPIRYPWARSHYKNGVANNWTPEEVSMQFDVEQWRHPTFLSDTERRMILWNLGFFSTAESLTANNIVLAIYRHITDPACRQYLLRQAYEEALHSDTFVYCCDSLGLDPQEVYGAYQTIPSITAKDNFVIRFTESVFDPSFEITDTASLQRFIRDLVGYYVIMEGIFFYAGFCMMLHLQRNQKMVGVGEQFQFILRDEAVHLAFGADLINTLVQESPEVWTETFKKELVDAIDEGVRLECLYVSDCLPVGILGLNTSNVSQYVQYIADRRLQRIGLPLLYHVENPFPWMGEIMDIRKEKNFFETRVTEYQGAGDLKWD